MSGHSKWSQIKHKKALTDAKKGKIFSKMARQITVAARANGGDPTTNASLRMVIDKARSLNMPADNIERAIKRGTGELADTKIEEFTLEAYGPAGMALIIEGTTDNKNRIFSEIKFILSQYGGKFAKTGSVLWLFNRYGILTVNRGEQNNQEELELAAIDAGAQDLKWTDEATLEICTQPEALEDVKKKLEGKNIFATEASLDWVPKSEMPINDQKTQDQIDKLLEALDENDDVSDIYFNLTKKNPC